VPSSAEHPVADAARDDAALRALLAACELRVASGACPRSGGRRPGEDCCCELVRPVPGLESGPVELVERPVRLRGSALARAVLRLAGWRVNFDGLPARQGVIIAYPHTSNWDFVWGVLAKWAIGLPVTFWGKDTLFRVPLFGRWLRWIGGLPVDRKSAQGVVAETAGRLRAAAAHDQFMWLALAPEGTRSYAPGWRSGFWHVALQARVPLAIAYFDYVRKEVGVDSAWRLSGDERADFACFARRLEGRMGRKPANMAPIRLR